MRHIFPGAFLPPPPEPSMPQGLVQLMEGLSRDVIVHSPTDVYKFCAEHMHKLLHLRDAQNPKPPPKTLEEKIAIAQAKVRERIKQRQRRASAALKSAEDTTVPQDEIKDGEKESIENYNIAVDKLIPTDSVLALSNAHNVNLSENDKNDDENKTSINEDEEEMVNVVGNVEGHTAVNANLVLDEESNNQAKQEFKAEIIVPSSVDNNETSNLNGPTNDDAENKNLENESNVESKDLDGEVKAGLQTVNVDSDHIDKENDINEEFSMTEITEENCEEKDEVTNLYLNKTGDLITESVHTEVMGTNEKSSESNVLPDNEEKHTDFVINEEPASYNVHLPDVNLANNGKETDATKKDTDSVNLDEGSNDVDNLVDENNVESNDYTAVTEDTDVTNAIEQVIQDNYVLKTPDENILDDNVDLISASNSTNEPQSEVAINEALITDLVPENLEIVLRTDTDEDDPDVKSLKFNVEYSDTSKESPKKDKDGETAAKPTSNSAITNTPNDTVYEESSFSELTNGTDKIDDDNAPQNTEMDLETAAVTIQKVFRSFLVNRASTLDDVSNEESLDAPYLPDDISSDEGGRHDDNNDGGDFHNSVMNKERRGMGITRMDTVLQTVNEEKSLSLSDDSSTLSSAATVIQAHVRGFLVRNRMHSHKTISTNSFVEGSSAASMEADNEQIKNKTVLNIHIVPEGGHYLSRDESMAMSVDLPLDGSPPTSSSLHSLGYDITERRKLLKREDAIQSISPPSNNSGNSDMSPNGNDLKLSNETIPKEDQVVNNDIMSGETTPTKSSTVETVLEVLKEGDVLNSGEKEYKMSSDENDVVTPLVTSEEKLAFSAASDGPPRLLHSGEFHDLALPLPLLLPTKVSRSDSPVVREFKNVFGYFLIWN